MQHHHHVLPRRGSEASWEDLGFDNADEYGITNIPPASPAALEPLPVRAFSPEQPVVEQRTVEQQLDMGVDRIVQRAAPKRGEETEEIPVHVGLDRRLQRKAKRVQVGEDQDDASLLLRLGIKALGAMILLTVLQKRLFVSSLVGILGVAVVGGVYSFLEDRREHSNENTV